MHRIFRRLLRLTRFSSAYDSLAEIARLAVTVLRGVAVFRRTGSTPQIAYHSMILLHCRTQGRSNDLLHLAVRRRHPPYPIPRAKGLLGDLSRKDLRAIGAALRMNGYYIFPQPLPADLVEGLTRYARTQPCAPCPPPNHSPSSVMYDGKAPIAPRYDFSDAKLMSCSIAQTIVADLSLLAVAQEYLGCAPILDIATMWWSVAFGKGPSSEAAQLYHFDMDRIKWLKFFFYLTDVTSSSGPTCFIKGTHRAGTQPRQLLRHGYARITDEEMGRHFPSERFIELTCPKGSIVAVDTRGFHKGKAVEAGERLVFQIEYTDSLFGTVYDRPTIEVSSSFGEVARRYERVFSKFALREVEPLSNALIAG